MEMEEAFDTIRRIAFVAITFVIILLAANEVRAHDWYDGWCCNDTDCAPYLGEVQETPAGYFLPEFNITIPYSKPKVDPKSVHPAVNNGARYNMPGDDPYPYHLCEFPIGSKTVRCFYARQGGT